MCLQGGDSEEGGSDYKGSRVFYKVELSPCGMSVCRVLIQYASRSGRASGSQCSSRTILWSLRKSCDLLEKWRYRGTRLFFFFLEEYR